MSAVTQLQKPIEMRESDFKRAVNTFLKYPPDLRQEFIDYWTEPNKSNTRMKFEQEKTWELSRRLSRWANNGFNQKSGTGQPGKVIQISQPKKAPETDIEVLDALLAAYRKNPTGIEFDKLAQFYEPIKIHRLWPVITKGQMNEILELYKGSEVKCKAWIVEKTLVWYENNGWTFSETIRTREKLNT